MLDYLKKDTSNKKITDVLTAIIEEFNDDLIQDVATRLENNENITMNIDIVEPYYPESDFEDWGVDSDEDFEGTITPALFTLDINDFNQLKNRLLKSTNDENAKDAINRLCDVFSLDEETASCYVDIFWEVLKTLFKDITEEIGLVLVDFVNSVQKLSFEMPDSNESIDDDLPF